MVRVYDVPVMRRCRLHARGRDTVVPRRRWCSVIARPHNHSMDGFGSERFVFRRRSRATSRHPVPGCDGGNDVPRGTHFLRCRLEMIGRMAVRLTAGTRVGSGGSHWSSLAGVQWCSITDSLTAAIEYGSTR